MKRGLKKVVALALIWFPLLPVFSQESFTPCLDMVKEKDYGEVTYILGQLESGVAEQGKSLVLCSPFSPAEEEIKVKEVEKKGIYVCNTFKTDDIFVVLDEEKKEYSYLIYNECGKVCDKGILYRSGEISVGKLAPGSYLLRINTDNKKGFVTFKIVKK